MGEDHEVSDSRKLVKQVTDADTDLVDQMNGKGLLTDEIYKIYQERYRLYDNALKNPILDDMDKLFLDYEKSDLFVDLKMFKFKLDFEEQISQIVSRMDNLEDQLKILKKNLVKVD